MEVEATQRLPSRPLLLHSIHAWGLLLLLLLLPRICTLPRWPLPCGYLCALAVNISCEGR